MTIDPGATLGELRERKPLVHNITNYVVMNETANAILALGALPVMAHAEEEVGGARGGGAGGGGGGGGAGGGGRGAARGGGGGGGGRGVGGGWAGGGPR